MAEIVSVHVAVTDTYEAAVLKRAILAVPAALQCVALCLQHVTLCLSTVPADFISKPFGLFHAAK